MGRRGRPRNAATRATQAPTPPTPTDSTYSTHSTHGSVRSIRDVSAGQTVGEVGEAGECQYVGDHRRWVPLSDVEFDRLCRRIEVTMLVAIGQDNMKCVIQAGRAQQLVKDQGYQ